jgi:prepilin-type N-terminal cleavage/methylation domain-containing protein
MKTQDTTSRRTQRGFTMIEIAIAVGVIGFALVAIIGILPAGMNSQKDNREDTTISQDAPYFLNAIRNGDQGVTFPSVLAQYVDSISVSNTLDGITWTGTNYSASDLTNDMVIIGILSTPETDPRLPNHGINQVTAIFRAMSGSAMEQSGQNPQMAFRYQLTVQIVPCYTTTVGTTNYSQYQQNSTDPNMLHLQYAANNLHELRLKFAWPVIITPSVTNIGPGRQTYRTLVSSYFGTNGVVMPNVPPLWFFQPLIFSTNTQAMNL